MNVDPSLYLQRFSVKLVSSGKRYNKNYYYIIANAIRITLDSKTSIKWRNYCVIHHDLFLLLNLDRSTVHIPQKNEFFAN